jgi:hypothetical protein
MILKLVRKSLFRDFDNNRKTKELTLSSFFSEEVEIIEILSNK